MTRRLAGASLAALVLALIATGCGSSSNKTSSDSSSTPAAAATQTQTQATAETDTTEADKTSSEKEKDKGEEEGKKTECRKPATKKATGLPSSFPLPNSVTITEARREGPTVVADGYWAGDLDQAYAQYQAKVTQAGYQVLHKEHDPHDAEINYSGSGREGQIALKETCSESATTRVRITNRPQ